MVDGSDNPWAAAPTAQVALVDVLPLLERHRGIAPAAAVVILRPALESYRVENEVVGWRGGTNGPVAVKIEALRHRYYVSRAGWAEVDWGAGTIREHRIVVWWSHVLRAMPIRSAAGQPVGASSASPDEAAIQSSGLAGRPTSFHLVLCEYRRRVVAGLRQPSLKREAQELAEWLTRRHPIAHPCTAKTIEGKLRGSYNADKVLACVLSSSEADRK